MSIDINKILFNRVKTQLLQDTGKINDEDLDKIKKQEINQALTDSFIKDDKLILDTEEIIPKEEEAPKQSAAPQQVKTEQEVEEEKIAEINQIRKIEESKARLSQESNNRKINKEQTIREDEKQPKSIIEIEKMKEYNRDRILPFSPLSPANTQEAQLPENKNNIVNSKMVEKTNPTNNNERQNRDKETKNKNNNTKSSKDRG